MPLKLPTKLNPYRKTIQMHRKELLLGKDFL